MEQPSCYWEILLLWKKYLYACLRCNFTFFVQEIRVVLLKIPSDKKIPLSGSNLVISFGRSLRGKKCRLLTTFWHEEQKKLWYESCYTPKTSELENIKLRIYFFFKFFIFIIHNFWSIKYPSLYLILFQRSYF